MPNSRFYFNISYGRGLYSSQEHTKNIGGSNKPISAIVRRVENQNCILLFKLQELILKTKRGM
jgi:hypothetical protein